MPVCIEDECNSELPPASLLFRAARQYAYGVLFSLAETQRRLERLALRKRAPMEGWGWDCQVFGGGERRRIFQVVSKGYVHTQGRFNGPPPPSSPNL